jgi:hypothetical protein
MTRRIAVLAAVSPPSVYVGTLTRVRARVVNPAD